MIYICFFDNFAAVRLTYILLLLCFFLMTVIKSPHTGYLVSPAKTFYGRDTA